MSSLSVLLPIIKDLDQKFDALKQEAIDRLARVETKQDGIIERLDKINGTLKSHEERLSGHDQKLSHFAGVSSAVGAVAGFLSALAVALFGWFLRKGG